MIANKVKKLRNKEQGFTIIEVLIVLAIAGLILLIVFLAVPALQRNQRNTGRKSDAGHISTAINDYISNNNGSIIVTTVAGAEGWNSSTTGGTTICSTILADAGQNNLDVFKTADLTCGSGGDMAAGQFNATSYGAETNHYTAVVPEGGNDAVLFVTGATCGTVNGASVGVDSGSSSQSILIYTVESGGTNYNQACLEVN